MFDGSDVAIDFRCNNCAYLPAFIDAGAVLYETDSQQYRGLYGRLKDKGVGVTDWKRLVLARVRERQQEQPQAALFSKRSSPLIARRRGRNL